MGAQLGRADFRRIRSRQCLENTPRDPHENEANEKLRETFGKEDNENETGGENQSTDQGLPVADSVGNDTGEHQTEHLTNICAIGKTTLPRRADFFASIGKSDIAKCGFESRKGK